MALDPVINFFRSTIATLPLASGTTTMVIATGDGNKLPNPATAGAFNLVIYNADDPFASPEIVRCTAKSGDSLTITRAQEGTTATNKTAGSVWNVELVPTAKMIQDIDAKKLDIAGGTMTGDLILPNIGVNKTPTAGIRVDVTGSIRASTGILFGTDTASANRLDDYEEGTFTPAFAFSSGSVTYSAQVGAYTKIGNLVYARIALAVSAISSPTGAVSITGLPFSGISGANNINAFTLGNVASLVNARPDLKVLQNSSSSTLLISIHATNATFSQLQGSDIGSSTGLFISGCYLTT